MAHRQAVTRSTGQIGAAAVTGALIGAAGGAALGAGVDLGAGWGAVLGAVLIGSIEGITDARRVPGRPKPLAGRIASGAMLVAAIGWLADLVLPDWSPVVFGVLSGLTFGALGLRPGKLVLGVATGLVTGLGFEWLWPDAGLPWIAAVTSIAYRIAAAVVFRDEQMPIMGEQVDASLLDYVVPFSTSERYVGVDYLREYADLTCADFVRNPADIGIVASFDDLAGPDFDPGDAHPLIREFYEHTSRFHLSITPTWRWWMRPAYLVYRNLIAKPLGQANAPFDVEEVQRGVVSWIDAVDVDHSGRLDFRAWVRAYEEDLEPLYVGIYTVLRKDGIGYVSVGFPLPSANLTATLLPHTNRGDGLLLRSRTDQSIPGHYLSAVDQDTNELTTAKLRSFDEEIDVFVEGGELRTDHRFYLWGIEFMSLEYSIERKT